MSFDYLKDHLSPEMLEKYGPKLDKPAEPEPPALHRLQRLLNQQAAPPPQRRHKAKLKNQKRLKPQGQLVVGRNQ